MARTRSKDYDTIQAAILDETAKLFADRGYAATSIGDIAQACDSSKSRLYHYFGSKEDILAQMLTEHIDQLLEGCHDTLASHADPIERFRVLVRFFMEIYAVSSSKHVVLLTCIEFLPPETKETVLRKERELVSFVRDIITRVRPDIAADKEKSYVDTMLFFGMINWTYTWYRADGTLSPDALADRAVSIFLDGYVSFSQ